MPTLWTFITSDFYLDGAGHFATNSDPRGFSDAGFPYVGIIDKSTMEIVSTDTWSFQTNIEGVINQCQAMNTGK